MAKLSGFKGGRGDGEQYLYFLISVHIQEASMED